MESTWQSTKRTAVGRLSYLLDKQLLTDVNFIVGKEVKECIPAHQLILSMSSAVFFTMFNGSVQLTDDRVICTDIEPQAFQAVLKYIYSEVVEFHPSSVMATLYAAKKYELPGLEEECEKFLLENVSSENALCLLVQARFFNRPNLANLCLRAIDADPKQSFQSKDFVEIDNELLCEILSRDSLVIEEKDLFKAVVRWAVEQCKRQSLKATPENQRSVLKNALFCVRFPLMTVEDFYNWPAKSGLLTKDEIIQLFVHFNIKEKQLLMFPTKQRQFPVVKLKRFSRVGRAYVSSTRAINGKYRHDEYFVFEADTTIMLRGFGIYGSPQPRPVDYSGTLTVKTELTTETESFTYTSFYSTLDTPFVFHAKLPKPIKILAKTKCNVSVKLTGPSDIIHGRDGPSTVTVKHSSNAITFDFSQSYHCLEGIISEILFTVLNS